MPLLTDLASRAPISVADFNKAFAANHPSISYGQLKHEQQQQQRIYVKTLTGKTITLDDVADTVGALKAKIEETEGIPPEKQRLIYAGSQLKDETRRDRRCPLSHYGITDSTTVDLVLRLKGD
jgi:hypothetical protein